MEIKLSEQIKEIMARLGLKQSDLAVAFGVSLSRVKALTSGRVKKLDREEARVLVEKFNISGNWLATGVGDIFLTDAECKFQKDLDAVKVAVNKSTLDGLTDDRKAQLQQILFAVERGDTESLTNLLNNYSESSRAERDQPVSLSARQSALLDNYEHLSEDDKRALERTAFALAKSADTMKKSG